MQVTDGAAEWSLLQNQYDSYEKFSLAIKLSGILVLTLKILLVGNSFTIACVLAIIWLQDAIWKTFQSRIEHRLVKLETFFAASFPQEAATEEAASTATQEPPYQFNNEYQRNRGGTLALVSEYLKQAVRPTVAFPHAALLALCAFT